MNFLIKLGKTLGKAAFNLLMFPLYCTAILIDLSLLAMTTVYGFVNTVVIQKRALSEFWKDYVVEGAKDIISGWLSRHSRLAASPITAPLEFLDHIAEKFLDQSGRGSSHEDGVINPFKPRIEELEDPLNKAAMDNEANQLKQIRKEVPKNPEVKKEKVDPESVLNMEKTDDNLLNNEEKQNSENILDAKKTDDIHPTDSPKKDNKEKPFIASTIVTPNQNTVTPKLGS